MKPAPLLLPLALTLVLSGCGGGGEAADDHGHDHATEAQVAAGPPPAAQRQAPVTEAVYGDEPPVELAPAAPVDDHGHADDGKAGHDGHPHDDGDDAHDH